MIYFDNAATTGHKPQSVINAVNYALKKLSANPGRSGHNISQEAALSVYKTRTAIADFFGCEGAENVVFTANCTQSINFVLKGVLESGDHIVISDMEHNAVMRPLVSNKIQYTMAEVSLDNDDITVKNFENAIKNNTKMIFCTAASNVLGKTLPLEKIGEICKKRGLLFGVDAAQGGGIMPINMKKMNIDFLCLAPHKAMYAPMGIGVLIARKAIKKTIIEGGTGTDSMNFLQPDIMPEMLESGTVNMPAILATLAGINFIKEKGRCIYEHEMRLVKKLYKGLMKNKRINIYTNPLYSGYVPVLPFNIEGVTSDEVARRLNDKGIALRAGFHCAATAHKKMGTLKSGAVRFSPSVFNSEAEVNYLLKSLQNL